ncbi:MAG: glycosyltransferase [Flavobacteriales bacterium]
MGRPSITVVMPVYNAAAYLRSAIDSVLAQTCGDFELLLIDDGSTDGSAGVITSFNDPRIRLIVHKQNQGLVASLNEGIADAYGTCIARMDADDLMHPQRLEKQLHFMQANPGVDIVATFVDVLNADGEATGVWDTDRASVSEEEIRRTMPRTNCIAHPTVMMRASALANTRYRPEQVGSEDWDLWLRLLSQGHRIAKIPEALLKYRMHASSIMGGTKASVPLERRLLATRGRYLARAWWRPTAVAFNARVLHAQLRTVARHWKLHVLADFARAVYRVLSYSPIALLRERRTLRAALAGWNGKHLFLFPYLNRGGAEQVHMDILSTMTDAHPLVIVTGFSTDRGNEQGFTALSTLLELPRLLNHPFTRKTAERAIARKLNTFTDPVLFSSLTTTFFSLLPFLRAEVRTIWLQHAFLFQPEGNAQHRAWLAHFGRVHRYVFVSLLAKAEFEKLLFASNVPRSRFGKLLFLPNAVRSIGAVQDHEQLGVLFVGRDSPEKRLPVFVAVTQQLERAHPGKFRFTVVGPARVPSAGHVTFTGPVDDPAAMALLYAEHDVLAVTSEREGFPLVIMEAMAHGLAVLSTPVGDVPDRLRATNSIITSSTNEAATIAEMQAALLSLDADRTRLRNMKDSALEQARQEFSYDAFRERYRALLISPASSM